MMGPAIQAKHGAGAWAVNKSQFYRKILPTSSRVKNTIKGRSEAEEAEKIYPTRRRRISGANLKNVCVSYSHALSLTILKMKGIFYRLQSI